MRSALLCVFFALIVHKESSSATDEDFRPTPIPLNEWRSGARGDSAEGGGGGAAGTLQEVAANDAPPAAATVPAHYWEDALRHSVYLTLVRDKIDQLIAKGSVISPDGKPDPHATHEVDDHDLWEKIKSAPFDRLSTDEPALLGDITIMSKGRLLEENSGLRFTEDEMSKEKCKDEKCAEDVKAYWSVKRVRQRDAETAPGKYHYELTFSVSSQTPKKQKKPYENPVRTFTVREGTAVEKPQYRIREPVHAPRPQRAIWFHKNIMATSPRHRQKNEEGLDRLFSSWFSSEEELPPKRYKPPYIPQTYPQHSKLGQAGAPAEHYQKQPAPYPYKPQPQTLYKHPRPPLAPPPTSHPYPSPHQYLDFGTTRNQNQFIPPQTEYKYLPSNVIKTTKTTVLPTPPISYAPLNVTMEVSYSNVSEATTRDPEIITAFTMHSKPKPVPTKMSYFPEHVRPPVFNAPPGVFVTMDKKPFKPMPPLKYMHSHKPSKHRPVDFRPSPQVLDAQFSEPDPSEPFRPITIGYAGANTTDSSAHSTVTVSADVVKHKPTRKSKPPKKHDNTKSHRFTTTAPDIITANNEVIGEMQWANILGAFAKTSPMDAFKLNFSEFTTPLPSTTVSLTTTVQSTPSTTEAQMFTITTSKPKRTRPPPKFEKPVKPKKHKRVTSTTTTTTTTKTTEKPHHRRPSLDLTPQASSAATKSGKQPQNQTEDKTLLTTSKTGDATNITESSTTEPSATTEKIVATTYRSSTTARPKTTSEAPSSTTETSSTVASSHLKNNRFRQSTVMLKGTSINHDKWSSPYQTEKNKTTVDKIKPTSSFGKFPRRKGSNFQGYVSTPKGEDQERNRQHHVDHAYTKLNVISLSSTKETTAEASTTTLKPTQATALETPEPIDQDDVDLNDADEQEDIEDSEEAEVEEVNDEHQTKDHEEFIFDNYSADSLQSSKSGEKSNEVEAEVVITTEETVVTSPHSASKNKTKCKKKKNQLANKETLTSSETVNEISVAPLESTTEKLSTEDFFHQIFGLTVDQNETDGNRTDSKYLDNDEDLEEFLASINKKKDSNETNDDEYDEDEKEETENSPFNNEDENRFARHADSYEDYQDRPYSLLELMAME